MTETDDQCPNYGMNCFAHNGVEEFGGLCGSCWARLSSEDQNSIRSALGTVGTPDRIVTYRIPAQGGFLSRLAWSLWTAAITLAGWWAMVHYGRIGR